MLQKRCRLTILLLLCLQAVPPSLMAAGGGGGRRGDGQAWRALGEQFSEAIQSGDLDRSEAIARQRMDLAENGPPAWQGNALRNLGYVLKERGRYSDAEIMLRKALPLIEGANGPDSFQAIRALMNLTSVLRAQSRYAEAEAAAREVLQRQLRAAPRDPDVLGAYINYANVLRVLGRTRDARDLLRQAEQLDVDVAVSRDGRVTPYRIGRYKARIQFTLASAASQEGKSEEAARRAHAAVDIYTAVSPDDQVEIISYLGLEGISLVQLGQLDAAETVLRRATELGTRLLGPEHKETSHAAMGLALVLARQGKPADAEKRFRQALDGVRRAGATEMVARYGRNYARFLVGQKRGVDALVIYREALDAIDLVFARTQGLDEASRESYAGLFAGYYTEALQLLIRLDGEMPGKGYDREALSVVSRTQSRIFTELLRQADVSKSVGDPRLKELRSRQTDLKAQLADMRRARIRAGGDDGEAGEGSAQARDSLVKARTDALKSRIDAQSAELSRELDALEQSLWKEYPRYMELTQPQPVTVELLQKKLLRPDETLLSYFLLPDRVLAFVVSRQDFHLVQTPSRREDVAAWIAAARRPEEAAASSMSALAQLDPTNLNRLYATLFAPIKPHLGSRNKLLVIADGPIFTLPMEMLVERYGETEKAAFLSARQAPGAKLKEYGTLGWLGQKYQFNYLPSLSAFASIRLYRKPTVGFDRNLVSFADPVFDLKRAGGTTRDNLAMLARSVRGRGELNIPRLPETADEAREVAAIVGGRADLFLRDKAQEHTAKTLDLKKTRYLHFATHGLLGGEFVAVQEALAASEESGDGQRQRNLSVQAARPSAAPPKPEAQPVPVTLDDLEDAQASRKRQQGQPALLLSLSGDLQGEDGLLTMGEVIGSMDLNAQLVVLSACNTAGEGDKAASGEGFAGLTRAFMYAGAQGLLVSHWSVESQSTRELVTDTFRHLAVGTDSPGALGRAREEVKAGTLVSGGQTWSRAHPYFWAPFVYVGD